MKIHNLYILILLMFVISCAEEDQEQITYPIDETGNESKYLKLHKMYNNGSLSNTYEYDSLHRIISNTYQIGVYSYTYSQDTTYGVLTLNNGSVFNSSKRFSIDENTVKHEFFDSSGDLDYSRIYIYNMNSCGYSGRRSFDANGDLISYSFVEYLDSNCSSVEYFKTRSDELVKKVTIMKGSQYNAANSIRPQPRLFDKEFVWISRTEEDGEGNIFKPGTFDEISVINDQNYEISKTSTNKNGHVIEYEYEYY